jgi:hypothetical protein
MSQLESLYKAYLHPFKDQDGDRVRLEAGAGSLTGFELAVEDEGVVPEILPGRVEPAIHSNLWVISGCTYACYIESL